MCVYCASGPVHPELLELARKVGKGIADRGWTLVSGGGNVSAMGAVAAAARQFLYVRCYLETVAQMQGALRFYSRHGFINLREPLGSTGHDHNDRWMLRPLRASARHWVNGALGW